MPTEEQLKSLQGAAFEEVKPQFFLYDLTVDDISKLEIKKSLRGYCIIHDDVNYYKGFILNKKGNTQTVCEITFFPSKNGLYIPRLTFYKKTVIDDQVKEAKNPEKVRIAFDCSDEGLHEFWRMIGFLSKFKNLVDLGEFDDQYKIVPVGDIVLKLKGLSKTERIKELIEWATESDVDTNLLAESVLISERKKVLTIFDKLLNEPKYIESYKHENKLVAKGEEVAWHHFLKANQWLLGLNLDIQFIEDFIDETSVGNPNTDNAGNPKVDLMGLRDYTVLVELKTSNTLFFTENKTAEARAGTWSFSSEFIEGFSQCLAQKFEWDKTSESKDLIKDKVILDQTEYRTLDPKTIYIVGNKKKEIPQSSREVNYIIKRDTLERFRRNNRNIEIITYDELYDRAEFIVYGKKLL